MHDKEDPSEKTARKEVDIWRDTYVRFLGYANEVGEAVGPVYPKLIAPSYGVAFVYVACDTADKTYKANQAGADKMEMFRSGADCMIWQTLASVLIPGKFINIVANGTTRMVKQQEGSTLLRSLPPFARTWLPTAIALSTIPFIIHPIDTGVDWGMDRTIRTWWPSSVPQDDGVETTPA